MVELIHGCGKMIRANRLIRKLSIIATLSLMMAPNITSSQEHDTLRSEIPEGRFGIVGLLSTAGQTVSLFFRPESMRNLALYDAYSLDNVRAASWNDSDSDTWHINSLDSGDLALFEIQDDGENTRVVDAWYINSDDLVARLNSNANQQSQSAFYVGIEKYAAIRNAEIGELLASLRQEDNQDHIELWTNWDATASVDMETR